MFSVLALIFAGCFLDVEMAFGLSLPKVEDYIRLTDTLLRCSPL